MLALWHFLAVVVGLVSRVLVGDVHVAGRVKLLCRGVLLLLVIGRIVDDGVVVGRCGGNDGMRGRYEPRSGGRVDRGSGWGELLLSLF